MNTSINFGDRVTHLKNGKTYEVSRVWVDSPGTTRGGVPTGGLTLLRIRPINPKTGKAWQGGMNCFLSDVTKELA